MRLSLSLTLLFLLLFPLAAVAQTDSVSASAGIVEKYHAEADSLLKAVSKDLTLFRKSLEADRDRALRDIQSTGWAEAPGPRRFRRIYGLVDDYTAGVIGMIKKLGPLSKQDQLGVNKAVERLSALRDEKLKELEGTLKAETFEKERPKPVPLIDRSPFDEVPGEEQGIWFR